MGSLNNYLFRLYLSKHFIVHFKNVIRLKHCIFQPICYESSHALLNFKETLISPPKNAIFGTMYSSQLKQMSRWTKCSTSGIHMSQTSRKNKKNRSVVFSEKVKLKFQTARKETKRKVQKKIGEIKENVLTVPNALCTLRIISTPFLGYLVLSEYYTTSLGIFVFAGLTDLIDGYIARNFPNQQTMIGSFLDPAADKLLIATLFITLTANGLIPVPLTSLIILRDACLMGAGFYIRYVSLPPPKTFSRYFDMSFVTARLSPTTISKANTLIQLSLVGASLAAPVFSFVDHLYLHVLWYVTGTTTVLSAVSYLYYKNSTYKLFSSEDKTEK